MIFDKKYLKPLGIALSLQSTILGLAYFTYELINNGIISKGVGFTAFFLVIFNLLWLMVRYARNRKNKS